MNKSPLQSTAISLLDLAHVTDIGDYAEAFSNVLATARHAEELGYTRFWLAEHHNMDGIGSSATPVLIGHVAAGTKRIRVGSGGVMLPNHSPLVVAETFGTLETLYPGRIDLGLGRAPGTDHATARALRRQRTDGADNFPEQLAEVQFFLGEKQVGQRVTAIPGVGTHVPIWLLGSSLFSAQLAAKRGLPYAFASHFAPRLLHEALHIYRSTFVPSATLAKPYAAIGVPLAAADSDEQAQFLFTTAQQNILNLLRGQPLRKHPPVDDMARRWSPDEHRSISEFHELAVVGSPQTVRRQLENILAETQADELIFTSNFYRQQDNLRSLEIAAEVCRG